MKRRVVITGVGAVTPLGNNTDVFWKAILQGKSGVGILNTIDTSKFNSKIAAEVKDFDPLKYLNPKQVKKTDRFAQFAVSAAGMAIDDSDLKLENEDPYQIGCVIGSGIGGMQTIEAQTRIMIEKGPDRLSPFVIPMLISNMASGLVSIQWKLKGPNACIVTACASGTHSIGDAFRLIQHLDADIMIAGGTEACITVLGFGGFDKMQALCTHNEDPATASRPFDKTRNGFVIGEGSGIVVLEELEHALKRNAKIYCEIIGYGLNADANHITAPDPEALGTTQCMVKTLRDAGIKPEQIDYINAHGTSTELNDKVETLAIKKAFGDHAKRLKISSTKSMTGHLLGAAGGVEAVICALALKEQIAPPTANYKVPDPDCDLYYVPNQPETMRMDYVLSNSFGFGGHNASLCFKSYKG